MPVRPLASHLRPPRAHLDLVVREALVERLRRTVAPLVLVSAPAGYGKTVLLTQWIERDGRPHAWLQLAPIHDDAVAFLTYLTTALAAVTEVDEEVTCLLGSSEPPIDDLILPRLLAAVDAASPFVFVLDDGHLMSNVTCWSYLELLIRQLPDRACVALATRNDPHIPLARLRTRGDAIEIRTDELRMSGDEARSLLALHGCEASTAELTELLETTEGWATGISLALLAGDGCPPGELPVHVRGDRREIAEYLTAEVVGSCTDDDRTFLLRTAILDQLSPGLCRAVTGRDDADRALLRLAKENAFVVALDDRGEWYRYHHLFGELLQTQLERRAERLIPDLHRRAAAWYRDNGDPERAVRHAVAAGDGDDPAVADLAARACDALIGVAQEERARQLLEHFSDRQLAAHPALAVSAMGLATYLPDPRVQRWGRLAAAMPLGDGPTPVGAVSMRSWQAAWRAILSRDGAARMLDDAELACDLEAGNPETSWLLAAQMMRSMALYLLGRVNRCLASLDEAAESARGRPDEERWFLGLRTLIAADQGRWDEAMELDREAQAKPVGADMLPPILSHALVLAHAGDPALAGYLRVAEQRVQSFTGAQWRRILAATTFAGIALARDDAQEAERWVAGAEKDLTHWPDAGILRGRVKRLREALEERRMADPLTAAERRVLDLLPTQLTAAQVAARLFVTTNTVKSHMSRIYRKLGVTTRTAAVDRARELGLL